MINVDSRAAAVQPVEQSSVTGSPEIEPDLMMCEVRVNWLSLAGREQRDADRVTEAAETALILKNTPRHLQYLQHESRGRSTKLTPTVCFHPHCGEFWVGERWVADRTGHAVLVLQVGGESEGAGQGGSPVGVGGGVHVHSKGVTWSGEASDRPANLRRGPAADGGARHRLIVGTVYRRCRQLDLDVRPSCERSSRHVKMV